MYSIKSRCSKSYPTVIHNLLHIIKKIHNKKFIAIEINHTFAHVCDASNEATNAAARLARLRSIVNLHIHVEPEYGNIKCHVFA